MKRPWLLPALLFLGVLAIYLASPIATPFDSRWVVHTALSLIHEQNLDLDEYGPLLERDHFYATECIMPDGERRFPLQSLAECPGGHLYHYYPVAVPILVAPAVATLELSLRAAQPLLQPITSKLPPGFRRSFLEGNLAAGSMPTELILGSVLVALSAAVVFLFAREYTGGAAALGVALIYAFATPAWSTGSRALWMHGFSMLILPVALWALWRERWMLAGAILALAFFVRPTNAVPVLCAVAWTLFRGRAAFLKLAWGAAPVTALFVAISLSDYGSIFAPYFFVKRGVTPSLSFHHRIPEALLGNLVSPSRGLFVFSPVLLFSLAGLHQWMRRRETHLAAAWITATCLGHYVLMSCYQDWFGGHSYGPRYMSDLSSLLALALIPALPLLRAWWWRALFGVTVAVSLFMHAQGAFCWPCVDWNTTPVEIRYSQQRLWDWSDPSFLRNLR